MKKLLFGLDLFCVDVQNYSHLNIGLVTNDVATTSNGIKSRLALIKAGFNITKLFSPEHGIAATAADGTHVSSSIDSITQLPIVSLYSDKLEPTEDDLKDIDAIVFDIPDVGCRFYTYLWTMTHIMEACVKHNKPFILLDRPNPISGNLDLVEGPMLDNKTASFLGRWNIPIRHSCTLGELAVYFAHQKIPNLDLQIIPIKNWHRATYADTNWSFKPTSPAIKDVETALLYPGLGLLEGINVNEGRGTDFDFKILGAPWIDSNFLKTKLESLELAGITFSSISYTPSWGLYSNETCYGVQFKVMDAQLIRPVSVGLTIIKTLILSYPNYCKPRLYKTNAHPNGRNHLDKLLGIYQAFQALQKDEELLPLLSTEQWLNEIHPFLLYN